MGNLYYLIYVNWYLIIGNCLAEREGFIYKALGIIIICKILELSIYSMTYVRCDNALEFCHLFYNR